MVLFKAAKKTLSNLSRAPDSLTTFLNYRFLYHIFGRQTIKEDKHVTHHFLEFVLSFSDTFSIVGVDHKDQALRVLRMKSY